MKSLFSISMSLLVLIGTFSDAFIYITFKINQDYIAQELCINLDKPEVMCQGKCFLDDQLAKVNTNQPTKNSTPPKFEKKDIPLFFKKHSSQNEVLARLNKKNPPVLREITVDYEKHLKGVFHPPQES